MKKRITTILLTFAIAITGINAPANKANAETTTETATETPTATPTPAPTDAPEEVEWVDVEREGSYFVCPVKDAIDR